MLLPTHRSPSLQTQRYLLWHPAHRRAPKRIANCYYCARYPIPDHPFKVLGGQHRFLVNGLNDLTRPLEVTTTGRATGQGRNSNSTPQVNSA